MDPQATWTELRRAYAANDWPAVEEHAQALLDWLDKGGFPPETIRDPPMGNHWNRALTRHACFTALMCVSAGRKPG